MIYQWKTIPPIARIEAQVAGEELERIRVHHNGRLEPRHVLEASRPDDAPLHAAFEWDDQKAAEAHRLGQASHIIRHIDVVIEEAEEPTVLRAFVSVVRDEDRSYTSVSHAMADPDLRRQVVLNALKELEAWRHRYAELVELANVFAAIDEARTA